MRSFYQQPRINGEAPEFGVRCGPDCPPGPGYWPMAALEHPSDLGWRHPLHALGRRAFSAGVPEGAVAVVAAGVAEEGALWSAPGDRAGAEVVGSIFTRAGDRYPLLAVEAGDEATRATGAEASRLWYALGVGQDVAWVRAALPSSVTVGASGRAAAVRLRFVPDVG